MRFEPSFQIVQLHEQLLMWVSSLWDVLALYTPRVTDKESAFVSRKRNGEKTGGKAVLARQKTPGRNEENQEQSSSLPRQAFWRRERHSFIILALYSGNKVHFLTPRPATLKTTSTFFEIHYSQSTSTYAADRAALGKARNQRTKALQLTSSI